MGAILALLTLTASLTLPPRSLAWAADRQVEINAREAFAAGRFDDALSLFAKLYAETLHPVYLRNIGRCHQRLRQPQKAIDSFGDYLAKSKKIPPAEKVEIEGFIKEMEALRDEQAAIPTQPMTPPPAGAATSPAPSAPPLGTSVAPVPSVAALDSAAASSPGVSLVAAPEASTPSPSPVYTRWWFWTGVGAVVIGGVVATVLLTGGATRPPCVADTCL